MTDTEKMLMSEIDKNKQLGAELSQARARLKWALIPGNGVAKMSDGSFMFNTRTATTETIAAMRRLYDTADDAIDAAIAEDAITAPVRAATRTAGK